MPPTGTSTTTEDICSVCGEHWDAPMFDCACTRTARADADAAEQVTDEIVGQLEQAQNERDDAQAALDLAATRWDNTRGYVADLLGSNQEQMETAARLYGTESQEWAAYEGERRALTAVASFMDGQLDGSVTRG